MVATAKPLAEKNNPKADVVWGLAATSLLLLKTEGMLEPYAPQTVAALDPRFVDSDGPPSGVGLDAWIAANCFNTVEAPKLGLPAPTSWEDLTKPDHAGHVVVPNPTSSGTCFLDISSWIQIYGEDDGYDLTVELPAERVLVFAREGWPMPPADWITPQRDTALQFDSDRLINFGFMLVIALYLIVTLALLLYIMLAKSFVTYGFDLTRYEFQVSDEAGTTFGPLVTAAE